MSEHIIFLIAAYIAAVFATIAGFGSSTILIPVALFFMDLKTAVFLVACFHLFNNLFKVKLFFKQIDFKLFWQFGLPSIVFAFIGARLITTIPPDVLKKGLAVFLLAFSVWSLLKPDLKIKGTPANALLGGSLSGLFAGLIGVGGAIRASFLISFGLSKELYIATSALIAFVVDLTRIPTYLFTGVVENSVYYQLLPFLLIIAYLGVRTGKVLLGRIDQEIFRKIVLVSLILVSIKLYFS